jgi:hypothetical protein
MMARPLDRSDPSRNISSDQGGRRTTQFLLWRALIWTAGIPHSLMQIHEPPAKMNHVILSMRGVGRPRLLLVSAGQVWLPKRCSPESWRRATKMSGFTKTKTARASIRGRIKCSSSVLDNQRDSSSCCSGWCWRTRTGNLRLKSQPSP